MAYNPTVWVDKETPVNAENLNKMEQAVQANNTAINEINTARENGEFKGDKGDTGATGATGPKPVKGTDYWTPADQEAIVQDVIAALGTPVFGRVDADNNIILTGELADGVYTLKYEDADGNVVEVGTISNIETSGEIALTLTMGKIDSSTGAITASDNMLYSQAIPVESGKKYRLVANGICGGFKIAYYDATDQFISCTSSNLAASESGQLINVDKEVPLISEASYFRLRVSVLWYNGGYTEAIALLRNNVRLLWERT